MKKVTLRILCLFALFISFKAHSQVKIGDNARSINPNSLLELESSTKGLLLPRLTNNQIKAMTNVPVGMLLFSITDSALYLRKDTGWAILGFKTNPSNAQWASNGNDIYNINSGKVGIGTKTPYSLLSNTPNNVLDKEGYGGNAGSSFNWIGNGPGYAGMISNFNSGRGLLVRTGTGNGNALEVDAGDSSLLNVVSSGKVGVGTNKPLSKLQVNGDLLLQKGANINEFSKDSTFSANSDSMVPTEKAIKDYLKSGKFIGGTGAGVGGSSVTPSDTITQNLLRPFFVTVRGNYAYVASSGNNQLCIYDISNPNAIVAKGFTNQNLSQPNSVAVQGNYAYVASYANNQLCIFDISNPDAIVAKGVISQNLSKPFSVAVQGNYAYVTSTANNQLCIFDVSNPNAIVAKDTISQYLENPFSVAVQGNYAYVISTDRRNQLCIYDISNPDSIIAKGTTSDNLVHPISLAVRGNYAYVASLGSSQLSIFDISNPSAIVDRGVTSENLSQPFWIAVQGNYAYVTNLNNQLSIFDISNPDNIIAKGTANQNLSGPFSVAAQGDYAYVTSQNNNTLVAFDYHLTPVLPVLNGDSLSYSNVLGNYVTQSDLNQYATTDTLSKYATINSLGSYATIKGLSNYVSLVTNQSITGAKTFTANTIFNSKVGIGTATPYSQLSNTANNVLDIEGYGGNTASSFNWVSKGAGYAGMISNASGGRGLLVRTALSNVAGNALEVNAAGKPLLNVLSSGNVGIGTVTPSAKLDVNGDVHYTGTLDMGIVDSVVSYTSNNYGYDSTFSITVGCPTDYKLIGGGGGQRDFNAVQQNAVFINFNGPDPNDLNRWRIYGTNIALMYNPSNSNKPLVVQAYSICAKVK